MSVTLARADAGGPGARADAVITNPPWNLAVDGAGTLRDGLGPLWRRLPALVAPGGRFVAITDATLDAPAALARAGFGLGPATRVRLAGRVSDVVLGARATAGAGRVTAAWRERAIAAGVVTAEGFYSTGRRRAPNGAAARATAHAATTRGERCRRTRAAGRPGQRASAAGPATSAADARRG